MPCWGGIGPVTVVCEGVVWWWVGGGGGLEGGTGWRVGSRRRSEDEASGELAAFPTDSKAHRLPLYLCHRCALLHVKGHCEEAVDRRPIPMEGRVGDHLDHRSEPLLKLHSAFILVGERVCEDVACASWRGGELVRW